MKNDNEKTKEVKDEPVFGNEHLPKIEITVSQTVINYRGQTKEYILTDESLYYALAIFNLMQMVSTSEVHRDTDTTFALRTLGFLGKTFTEIALNNLEYLEGRKNVKN